MSSKKPVHKSKPFIRCAAMYIGAKLYQGENHAETIMGAVKEGQDVSRINRWKDGLFITSDERIITREQAKQEFGISTSEEIPLQFGLPKAATVKTPTFYQHNLGPKKQ